MQMQEVLIAGATQCVALSSYAIDAKRSRVLKSARVTK